MCVCVGGGGALKQIHNIGVQENSQCWRGWGSKKFQLCPLPTLLNGSALIVISYYIGLASKVFLPWASSIGIGLQFSASLLRIEFGCEWKLSLIPCIFVRVMVPGTPIFTLPYPTAILHRSWHCWQKVSYFWFTKVKLWNIQCKSMLPIRMSMKNDYGRTRIQFIGVDAFARDLPFHL